MAFYRDTQAILILISSLFILNYFDNFYIIHPLRNQDKINGNRVLSQYGEDKILYRLFPKKDGTCIEVGANDGVKYSTSLFFERIGWNCILVEPTPYLCSAIRKVRKSTLFEYAASATEGETDFL